MKTCRCFHGHENEDKISVKGYATRHGKKKFFCVFKSETGVYMQNNITFTSGIRAIPCKQFSTEFSRISSKNSVDYPWTLAESVKSNSAYTRGVADCTVCGITDGKDVLLMHVCPTMKTNHNVSGLRQFIARNIDLKNENLQGILIGSKQNKLSQNIYNMFLDFLNNFHIPFSELKIANDKVNVGYMSSTDEWLVSSLKMDKLLNKGENSKDIFTNTFEKVTISVVDEIV